MRPYPTEGGGGSLMNKRGLSRMLSVLLLLVMVVSMLPVSAYAEGAA